ncbi:MAG: glycosyltransferase family 2 protein [Bacteroidetes bacterium]|nr:MAG: glycosyltransferase family 2 protein [Bacteroidota bacterium]
MNIFVDILEITQLAFYLYIASSVLVLFAFSFASLFPYKPKLTNDGVFRKVAIIIPAYSEDNVILEVVKSARQQHYPKDKFDIVVVADHFLPETLQELSKYDIILLAKDFEISTKSRAINYAFEHLHQPYDIAVILDADNIMGYDFLITINHSFASGYKVVQGHRTAKNLNTRFALLDSISEEINNSIFRKGFRNLNFSSALIGSAMAFDFTMFKKMMKEVEVVGGFDKEIEMRLSKRRIKVEYLPNTYVYDEKVQNAEVFTRQRRRWLSAQIHFFGRNFFPSIKSLFTEGNIEYFVRAMIYVQLPRVLLLAVLVLMIPVSLLVNNIEWTIAWTSALIFIIFVFAFAIPRKFYNFSFLKAVVTLPLGIFMMMISLFSYRKGNKKFIHTKHTYNAFQIKKHKHH